MWRLTICQAKQYSDFKANNEVSFESEDVNDLLVMVSKAAALNATNVTGYEISEVKSTTEGETK